MKIGSCFYKGRTYLCVPDKNNVVSVPALDPQCPDCFSTVIDFLHTEDFSLESLKDFIRVAGDKIKIADSFELLAPIPRPLQNIMCLGLNYVDHVEETSTIMGREAKIPEHIIVFTKAANSVNAPYGDIPYDPGVSSKIDWESELGVIIGKPGKRIKAEHAYDHVFGYTVINDISARDLQRRHKQFFLAKSLEGSCPMGPFIVTTDEIKNPHDLEIQCRVNGKVKQKSNTKFQIFDIPTQIATISKGMNLEPGDIIATGTPSGVGFARTPPEYLIPGDVVECEVEKIGTIRNKITEVVNTKI
jgi:2-keto-4-pentenoate hydratase/2-oxohepta-3-ene-1,7-dioic acid hydratase in catechol pathway